jgi:hypothetical protein
MHQCTLQSNEFKFQARTATDSDFRVESGSGFKWEIAEAGKLHLSQ